MVVFFSIRSIGYNPTNNYCSERCGTRSRQDVLRINKWKQELTSMYENNPKQCHEPTDEFTEKLKKQYGLEKSALTARVLFLT